jgi:hypothetical protein
MERSPRTFRSGLSLAKRVILGKCESQIGWDEAHSESGNISADASRF